MTSTRKSKRDGINCDWMHTYFSLVAHDIAARNVPLNGHAYLRRVFCETISQGDLRVSFFPFFFLPSILVATNISPRMRDPPGGQFRHASSGSQKEAVCPVSCWAGSFSLKPRCFFVMALSAAIYSNEFTDYSLKLWKITPFSLIPLSWSFNAETSRRCQ